VLAEQPMTKRIVYSQRTKNWLWFCGALAVYLLAANANAAAAASCATMKALAQEHSNDMARRNSMDHDGFFERRLPRGARAENVMAGVKTEREAMAAWRGSPPHAANMALPGCKGVARACNKDGRCFWTMEIGRASAPRSRSKK
jgi:uncharacterized protein YkwD